VVRSTVTAQLVLTRFAPGVTRTASVTAPPWKTTVGDANPRPDGGVETLHATGGDVVLRGAGEEAVKSATLLSVSVQPPSARKAAVVLESAGAGVAPSKKFAPS